MNLNENENIEEVENKSNGKIKQLYIKYKSLIWEIFRFLVVGGLATLVDWSIFYVTLRFIPEIKWGNWSVNQAIAITCGFVVGLVINYTLSLLFVYKNKKNENSGKSVKDFILFTIIGVFVLLLSYLGQYIMADLWNWYPLIARIIMTGIGLIINYLGRKIFIFK